jgi:dephospho-CoA kinase
MKILFISGLTGVGKSTSLKALIALPNYVLLPNRRDLTDQIIIPEILNDEEKDNQPINDRLERFRITAEYRKKHNSGMIHALQVYLATLQNPECHYIFDNIRGLEECQAAIGVFSEARIIFLDAPALVRLGRLVGRQDSFDHVSRSPIEASELLEQLECIQGINAIFNPLDIVKLKTQSIDDTKILDAVKIIVAEHNNYNAEQAACYLKSVLSDKQLLYLATSKLTIRQVATQIEAWL